MSAVAADRTQRRDDARRMIHEAVAELTDGEDLPAPPECVSPDGDDLAGLLPALEAHARELGFVVYYYEPEGSALGFCDPAGMRIVVSTSLSPNAQVSTLVHELAHAHGL